MVKSACLFLLMLFPLTSWGQGTDLTDLYRGDWMISSWEYEYLEIQRAKKDSVTRAIMQMPMDKRPKLYEALSQFDYKPVNEDYLDDLYDFFVLHIEPGNNYLQSVHGEKIAFRTEFVGEVIELFHESIELTFLLDDSGETALLAAGVQRDNLKIMELKKLQPGPFDRSAYNKAKKLLNKSDWEISYQDHEELDTLEAQVPRQVNWINGHLVVGIGKAGKLSSATLMIQEISEETLEISLSSPFELVKMDSYYQGATFAKGTMRRIDL